MVDVCKICVTNSGYLVISWVAPVCIKYIDSASEIFILRLLQILMAYLKYLMIGIENAHFEKHPENTEVIFI